MTDAIESWNLEPAIASLQRRLDRVGSDATRCASDLQRVMVADLEAARQLEESLRQVAGLLAEASTSSADLPRLLEVTRVEWRTEESQALQAALTQRQALAQGHVAAHTACQRTHTLCGIAQERAADSNAACQRIAELEERTHEALSRLDELVRQMQGVQRAIERSIREFQ